MSALQTWPDEHTGAGQAAGAGSPPSGWRSRRAKTTTARSGVSFHEYGQYRELFYNLTLRELRSKYKRSVIGWGWSMINPLANMAVYTIVFSVLLKTTPPEGVPSGVHNYAIMLLAGMLPWAFFSGSVMESMGSLLGNQNLIQKTYFPRELIPASTVASKIISHLIEMGLLMVAVIGFGNWRAPLFIPGVLVLMAVVAAFALGLALLFSIGNVFYRDIQHFSGILFFIWMFLTPVVYPFYIVGGGLNGSTGAFSLPRHLGGLSLGSVFKLNPMTDAVLLFQQLIYNGSLPSSSHVQIFKIPVAVPTMTFRVGRQLKTVPAHTVVQHVAALVQANVSWGDFGYLVFWAVAALAIGLAVFRKYEPRLPEEL